MIFFPTIGTQIRLTAEWPFRLYGEYRNDALLAHLGYANTSASTFMKHFALPHTDGHTGYDNVRLPAGTILKVDRIYIRKGAADFDSVTFYATYPGAPKKLRFWAKVADINGVLQGEIIV